jgi:hypothetical protein
MMKTYRTRILEKTSNLSGKTSYKPQLKRWFGWVDIPAYETRPLGRTISVEWSENKEGAMRGLADYIKWLKTPKEEDQIRVVSETVYQ